MLNNFRTQEGKGIFPVFSLSVSLYSFLHAFPTSFVAY